MQYRTILNDAQATDSFGHELATALKYYLQQTDTKACMIFLQGELGVGKTSLVRACLRAFGVKGAIKSPTYTLLEPYEVAYSLSKSSAQAEIGLKIAHLDLYRLQEPEELDYLGGRDLKDSYQLIFVEWPEKAHGLIPQYDINIQLNHRDIGRELIIDSKLPLQIDTLKY